MSQGLGWLSKGNRSYWSYTTYFFIPASRPLGKQNIAEGSKASLTSTEMELKLINVARASLEELLLDDQDYLPCREPAWHVVCKTCCHENLRMLRQPV